MINTPPPPPGYELDNDPPQTQAPPIPSSSVQGVVSVALMVMDATTKELTPLQWDPVKNAFPVGGPSGAAVSISMTQPRRKCLGQVRLGTGETTIFTAAANYDDVLIWLNNNTGDQITVTLNLRLLGAAAGVNTPIATTVAIPAGGQLILPPIGAIGLSNTDIVSGLCSSANGCNALVFGRLMP